ncbi:DUF4271 domain-containing protein [Pontibacter fetidus]|uniref:DUF4271 domain-containing protein n=1 Tax=Pontibacter fetidus TaxID=2700082 RepID=A0A6B2H1A9_9BACT|nr:DUF4271 domain-containing protein [Pontibacter fetidus]NDK56895.1 DUF4271 domain-containing protein [Pontibacter fetidus]
MPAKAQVLPLEQDNAITTDWLVYKNGSKELVPYIEGVTTESHALHQWLQIIPDNPFPISFVAPKGLCLFLNNQLIFVADATQEYKLNLAPYARSLEARHGKYLLTVWHPQQQPIVSTFRNIEVQPQGESKQAGESTFAVRVREYVNLNAFIIFTLLLGLLYGALKSNYPSDFSSLYNVNSFFRVSSLQEGFLVKPVSSWSSILFVLVFSLSLALLIAAIHTEMLHVRLLAQLIPASAAGISSKIISYTVLIFLFILLKYFFLKMMAFIFGLEQVVHLQYREFLRTILFLGIFLPVIVLFYLAFNASMPQAILVIANMAVSLMLAITVVRVFATVNTKASVLNLHLFSYLCATEVIPLAIILKLIVFNF